MVFLEQAFAFQRHATGWFIRPAYDTSSFYAHGTGINHRSPYRVTCNLCPAYFASRHMLILALSPSGQCGAVEFKVGYLVDDIGTSVSDALVSTSLFLFEISCLVWCLLITHKLGNYIDQPSWCFHHSKLRTQFHPLFFFFV